MRDGLLLQRLRFLRRRKPARNPFLFLNDAPRQPPIATSEQASDASSVDFFEFSSDLRASKASQDHQCLICMDDIPAGTSRTRLPCKHASWHPHCVAKWLTRYPRCPLCNAKLSQAPLAMARDRDSPLGMANHDLSWLLLERRLSLVSRPVQRHQRRFARSATDRR
ncbi:hypothetical protein FGB62_233g031 [Gracilaria domingensis]|nr:hypothetical protein FGB62_233g031 [Gracilaria domingensis]